jgi:hypothetical protein
MVDRSMGSTAAAVLARNPDYYLRRWLETWREFSTAPGPPATGAWCPITLVQPAWALYFTHLNAWFPLVILAAELAIVAHLGLGRVVRLVPILTYLSIAVLSTAIEPWPGQIRYRAQVEVFLPIAFALTASFVWGWARAATERGLGSLRAVRTG